MSIHFWRSGDPLSSASPQQTYELTVCLCRNSFWKCCGGRGIVGGAATPEKFQDYYSGCQNSDLCTLGFCLGFRGPPARWQFLAKPHGKTRGPCGARSDSVKAVTLRGSVVVGRKGPVLPGRASRIARGPGRPPVALRSSRNLCMAWWNRHDQGKSDLVSPLRKDAVSRCQCLRISDHVTHRFDGLRPLAHRPLANSRRQLSSRCGRGRRCAAPVSQHCWQLYRSMIILH